jgi:phosphoribosylaminoimidazolecarboxamide formyltransferase/IMP cyclohydrolase
LVDFAQGLIDLGFVIYSTGGTKHALHDAGLAASSVSDLTGFPEIMDGRVKTLHPGVHGGLLARRDKPEHLAALEANGLHLIDLLCVNLYPFVATVTRPGSDFDRIVENIDIGGPAMVRAAAKNHEGVLVVVRPERYSQVLAALKDDGGTVEFRRRLAAEAYAHTATYDSFVSSWLRSTVEEDPFGEELAVAGFLAQPLRYGENPHQKAAFYRTAPDPGGIAGAVQLQGKELSFNNIQDAAAALALVCEYDVPAAAIIKHMNPCGLALGDGVEEAYDRAFRCDEISAFGGVVALNRPLDGPTAERITSIFTEVVIAPSVLPEAREIFQTKKNLRLLEGGPSKPLFNSLDIRSIPGGFLAQEWDRSGFDRARCQVVTQRQPTEAEWAQLAFAWPAVKHVKSNAILLARDFMAVGVGAGQMSRVEAAHIAVARAGDKAHGSVMASDALFPFSDGLEVGIKAGATAVIQPGGSVRDAEVISAADAAGVAMVFTGERHFKH